MADSRAFYKNLQAALGSKDPVTGLTMLDWDQLSPTAQGYLTSALATGTAAASANLGPTAAATFDAYSALAYSGVSPLPSYALLAPGYKAAWLKCSGLLGV